jgi:hypothetical protein
LRVTATEHTACVSTVSAPQKSLPLWALVGCLRASRGRLLWPAYGAMTLWAAEPALVLV